MILESLAYGLPWFSAFTRLAATIAWSVMTVLLVAGVNPADINPVTEINPTNKSSHRWVRWWLYLSVKRRSLCQCLWIWWIWRCIIFSSILCFFAQSKSLQCLSAHISLCFSVKQSLCFTIFSICSSVQFLYAHVFFNSFVFVFVIFLLAIDIALDVKSHILSIRRRVLFVKKWRFCWVFVLT